MITANSLTKRFGKTVALDRLSCTIPGGCVYGLVGSNGAGKSTLLRLMSGVYRPDEGDVKLDEINVYEQPQAKKRLVFVADELFFLPQSSMRRMAKLYAAAYDSFDTARFNNLTTAFGLNMDANLATFSKGMRRQAASILALSCKTDYIFFDETFDGLDPVMRDLLKRVIYADVCERGATAVLTSHSLRELEDTCDQLALLHKGALILQSDVETLKTSLFKVQVAFNFDYDRSVFDGLDILSFSKLGSVSNIILKGDKSAALARISVKSPALMEVLPLSLEEVFIYEMDALGYAFHDITGKGGEKQ